MGYRYIGAKTKVVGEILSKIRELVPREGHVADLMCGTAAVSSELRKNRYQVTANDIMTFCYHHARVALLFQTPPTFSKAQEFIDEFKPKSQKTLFPVTAYESILAALNSVPSISGFFFQEFSPTGAPTNGGKPRNYFSELNAKKIDAVRMWIRKLHLEDKLSDLEHSLLLHDLIMAVNDVANIAGTYGHYLSNSADRVTETLNLKPTPLLLMNDQRPHSVLRGSAESVSKSIECDLCYIDPPYMKRQYAANYHILETLAREDEPGAVGVSGLRPWRDQYSNFCTKTRIRDSFRQIFLDMDCPHFLISYSEDGLLSLTGLECLLSEFGEVLTTRFTHKRFRSNNSTLQPYLTEYVLHLRVT